MYVGCTQCVYSKTGREYYRDISYYSNKIEIIQSAILYEVGLNILLLFCITVWCTKIIITPLAWGVRFVITISTTRGYSSTLLFHTLFYFQNKRPNLKLSVQIIFLKLCIPFRQGYKKNQKTVLVILFVTLVVVTKIITTTIMLLSRKYQLLPG